MRIGTAIALIWLLLRVLACGRRHLRDDSAEYPAGQAAERERLTQRTFVPVAELARTGSHLPRIDFDEWRADLDAMLDQEIPGNR